MGEGAVADVTAHPLTRPMVDECVAWYDRHFEPDWQDILLAPPDPDGNRSPLSYMVPTSPDDLRRMGRSFASTLFLGAGNITHTPAYGNLIALGRPPLRSASERLEGADRKRGQLPRFDREDGPLSHLSSGGATIGYRFRAEPKERAVLRIVKQRDDGLVVQGKIGMHTSPPYADDVYVYVYVYVGGLSGLNYDGRRATFVVPVSAPGVTVLRRKASAHHPNPFVAPLSCRFDELDGQMWLDDVFVPAAGSIAMQKARQRMREILRVLPGSSLVVAPSDTDLESPEMAEGLEESFCGGRHTARQRAAPLSRRITSRPRSTAASPPSNCTPMAASPPGELGCVVTLPITTGSPMEC